MPGSADAYQLPNDQFAVAERLGSLDADIFMAVLNAQIPAALFRNCLNPDRCKAAAEVFLASPSTTRRQDDVPARALGAFHYGKALADYFQSARDAEGTVARLTDLAGLDAIRRDLCSGLDRRGLQLRSAAYETNAAGAFVFRSWENSDAYSLKPHEDMAQLADPRQAGFEIQNCRRVLAANVCLQNGTDGGQVVIWNVRPSAADRSRYHIDFTGHPYPESYVEQFDRIAFAVRPGDVFLLNSGFVHAVTGTTPGTVRVTAAFFAGQLEDMETVVTWT